jgi:hypothetical protein
MYVTADKVVLLAALGPAIFGALFLADSYHSGLLLFDSQQIWQIPI